MDLEFQIICVDTKEDVKAKGEEKLLYLIISNSELWKKPEIRRKSIIEKDKAIICKINQIASSNIDDTSEISYQISVKGKYNELEHFRLKLIEYLKQQKFGYIYVTKDEVSKKIACELYPLINELETLLRGYLIKFFITKLGVNWWEITADNEMKQKAIKRKNNEKKFSKYIENKVFLIDFGELGKMVYSLSSGYISKEDIIKKILSIEENSDAIKGLKKELQSNYNKYFKETFKDNKFERMWQNLEKLRHKVAHNNLFSNEDLVNGKSLCQELKLIIENAIKDMTQFQFTEEEKEKIIENISQFYGMFILAWNTLFDELKRLASKNGNLDEISRISPRNLQIYLTGKGILDEDETKNISYLTTYRNVLVHSPNEGTVNELLTQNINLLKSVIKKLKSK
ncbi:MAG: hypothetical protein AB8G11_18695 [Saprospiraceae bacterium]